MCDAALAGRYRVRVGVGRALWRAAAGGREDAGRVPDAEETPRRHHAAAEDPDVRDRTHWTRLPALNI